MQTKISAVFKKTKLLAILCGLLLSAGMAEAASCTGFVPTHAEMYFGDDMELAVDTPYVYSTMNNLNKKCEFTCNAGYLWNGYACVLPAPRCTGTIPNHAEMYFGDDMMLAVDAPYTYSAVNHWDKACEFTCSSGYAWNGYACAALSYSCTGSVPANAQMYFGDDMMLTANTPYVYSAINNWNKACEFYCNGGYAWNGYACVLPAKKCTGTLPAHAEIYSQDDMMLTVDIPLIYSTINNLDKKCEFYCSSGYTWTGNACVL